jgi:hypothetical protein
MIEKDIDTDVLKVKDANFCSEEDCKKMLTVGQTKFNQEIYPWIRDFETQNWGSIEFSFITF